MADNNPEPPVLLTEVVGAVRVLRLNRPHKLNALDTALTRALCEALAAADADDGVRALVLAGAGRSFCSGADLGEFDTLTPANPDAVFARADLTSRAQSLLRQIHKPIVSAVQGHAMGGGAGLAIGCDMVVVAEDLQLGYPEMRHSVVPALVMTSLQRQVGSKIGFELISTGRILDAQEAVALGLANEMCGTGAKAEARAIEIAETWAQAEPRAMAAAKDLFYRVAELPYEQAMLAGRDTNILMRGFRG